MRWAAAERHLHGAAVVCRDLGAGHHAVLTDTLRELLSRESRATTRVWHVVRNLDRLGFGVRGKDEPC